MTLRAPVGSLWEVRRFRRLVLYSGGCHLMLFAMMLVGPCTHTVRLDTPPPIFVDLIEAPKLAAAPAAAPAARPAPAPEKTVIIPKPKPKPAPKPEAKPKPKPEAKPKPEPKEKPKEKPKVAEKPKVKPKEAPKLDDVLASIRTKVDSRAPTATAAAAAGGARGRFDPEMAAYHKQLKSLLWSNWVGGKIFRHQPDLQVRYEVEIDSSGQLRGLQAVTSSGNPHYDESAERAIRRSEPFPAPPRGSITLDVTFHPTSIL